MNAPFSWDLYTYIVTNAPFSLKYTTRFGNKYKRGAGKITLKISRMVKNLNDLFRTLHLKIEQDTNLEIIKFSYIIQWPHVVNHKSSSSK